MKKSLLFITSMIAINLYLNIKASDQALQTGSKYGTVQNIILSSRRFEMVGNPINTSVSDDSEELYSLKEAIALEKLTEEINNQARIKNARKNTLQRINTKFTPQPHTTLQMINTIKYGLHEVAHSPQKINHPFSPTHR